MNEAYKEIIKNLSPEKALEKIMETETIKFKHIKFNDGDEIHPIMLITMAAVEMGWNLAIPNNSDDEIIHGITCGTEEYLDEILPNNNKKINEIINIGVISPNVYDFNHWGDILPVPVKKQNHGKKIIIDCISKNDEIIRTVYHCLCRKNDVFGKLLNNIIETPSARENNEYNDIIDEYMKRNTK